MIGKWHISEEHKRFCELASGLGKICCFQEREGGMQSPLVLQDWAGSSFGVGCGAVIPPCSQSPPGWQCWFWVEAAELWDCPNPSELALIFIAFFAWALHFFLQLKIPWCSKGGVRRAVSLWYLSWCPGNVQSRRGSGALRPLPWNCLPFLGSSRLAEAGGRRDTFPWPRCPQWPNSLAAPWNLLLLWPVMWVPWFMHLYELCCTSEWEFCIHIYCLFSCVPYQMALLTVSQ